MLGGGRGLNVRFSRALEEDNRIVLAGLEREVGSVRFGVGVWFRGSRVVGLFGSVGRL